MTSQPQAFQAEVKELLQLVVHSLYSNKEIFLRELISNASDAADKLRFMGLSDSSLYEEDHDLKIYVDVNKDENTLTIRDNGIGMTGEEMASLLGTIAKSGTRELMNQLSADNKKNSQLIGQFGVGFYSAFIVADKVTVQSRKAGLAASEGAQWSSDGQGEFTLEKIEKADRGTEVHLKLKDDEKEFTDHYRVEHLIKKYSDHISIPVMMKKEDSDEYEMVNRATALWTLPKSEIKEEECFEFYKHLAHDFEDPLAWNLNRVEGRQEYTMLLFIPARAPFDMMQMNKMRGLKLYVQRVFIMDDAEQFLPHYLRFVRGLIDSNDLPLNISREILQGNKAVETMKASIVKRVLSMLEEMAQNEPEKYKKFWQEFGAVLKEGPAEDFGNKEKVAKLLRFASTHNNTEEQSVSLDDYIARMQPGQKHIYYVAGDGFNAVKGSPHLEMFRKKGIEVLLLADRIDEWLVAHLSEYSEKALHSVAKGDIDLKDVGVADPKEEKDIAAAEESFKDMVQRIQDNLKDKVETVRVSHRLTDSASCVVVGEHALSPQMERLLKSAGQAVPSSKLILEVNPAHKLLQRLQAENDTSRFQDYCELIFEEALLAEGTPLPDPMGFIRRVNELLV